MSYCQGLKVVGNSDIEGTAQTVFWENGIVWYPDYSGIVYIYTHVTIYKSL